MVSFSDLTGWISANGTSGPAILAASVAIVIFIATRLAEFVGSIIARRRNQRRIVIGLLAEVHSNLDGFKKFLDEMPDPHVLCNKVLKDNQYRPMVISSQSSEFYRAITASIPDIEAACLVALSDFYDQVQMAHAIGEAFEAPSFTTLSPEGRSSLVTDLWGAFRKAERTGWQAMYELELAYPRSWFREFRSLRSRRS